MGSGRPRHLAVDPTVAAGCCNPDGMRDGPWIDTVPDRDWTGGPLGDLHPDVVDRSTGRVDHIMSIHSLNPAGLAAHHGLYRSAMAGTASLRKVDRELIALVVSAVNRCHY